MGFQDQQKIWTDRYQSVGDKYLFGTEPNRFLQSQQPLFKPQQKVLCVADGEGRNSVWLAQQGLEVTAVEISEVAIDKAKRLASTRQVNVNFECADMLSTTWLKKHENDSFDWVVAIFIQFADPQTRSQLFQIMKQLTTSGGGIVLQGYTPKQLEYKTGGPSVLENLYTKELIHSLFNDWHIHTLRLYEEEVSEGQGHHGMSALMGVVAVKP